MSELYALHSARLWFPDLFHYFNIVYFLLRFVWSAHRFCSTTKTETCWTWRLRYPQYCMYTQLALLLAGWESKITIERKDFVPLLKLNGQRCMLWEMQLWAHQTTVGRMKGKSKIFIKIVHASKTLMWLNEMTIVAFPYSVQMLIYSNLAVIRRIGINKINIFYKFIVANRTF